MKREEIGIDAYARFLQGNSLTRCVNSTVDERAEQAQAILAWRDDVRVYSGSLNWNM
ncbi:hypothetical protein ABE562_22715 [Brucella intermedia]|uniref:hypothetical protein n=1 Tax=Brucella intermedia TaxID=94625 RepID=UPI001485D2F6